MFEKEVDNIRYSQVSIQSDMVDIKDFNQQTFMSLISECLKKRGQDKIAEMLNSKWEKKMW